MIGKYCVYVYVDEGKGIRLKAKHHPHMIEVAPGAHTVIITRKPIGKTGIVGVVNSLTGAAMGAAVGGGVGGLMGEHFASKLVGEDSLKNSCVIEFHENETHACDVKADWRGMPKVKWL
jgi:hypothetical protein